MYNGVSDPQKSPVVHLDFPCPKGMRGFSDNLKRGHSCLEWKVYMQSLWNVGCTV